MLKRYIGVTIFLVLLFQSLVTLAEPAPKPQILEQLSDLVDNLWEHQDKKAQTQTMADCRNIGNALMAWVVDNVSAAAAGADVYDMESYPLSSYEEMEARLVPTYIQELPRTDGWGHPFEYRVAWDNPRASHVILVRSPGKDGEFSGSTYESGSFDPDDVDQDIVWGDGFFLRWPGRSTGH